jgi:hypothetical protein
MLVIILEHMRILRGFRPGIRILLASDWPFQDFVRVRKPRVVGPRVDATGARNSPQRRLGISLDSLKRNVERLPACCLVH